jgi:hypothetical protein
MANEPVDLNTLLSAAEKANNLPAGSMSAILAQETGGNSKYLDDPAAYHYGLNKDGKRIAGHTGKVSTAFGPFGILESTGANPGFGVEPLKDKSLPEQVRFAAQYLGARAKHAGSFEAGLAGYGEGSKYASSVMGKMGKGKGSSAGVPMVNPVAALSSIGLEDGVSEAMPVEVPPQVFAQGMEMPQLHAIPQGPDPWEAFQKTLPSKGGRPVVEAKREDFFAPKDWSVFQTMFAKPTKNKVDFSTFGKWGKKVV